MAKIIIYTTRYGTSKKFAEKIAEEMNCESIAFSDQLKMPVACEEILFVTPLYAGNVRSLSKLIKQLGSKSVKLSVIVIGLSDPNDAQHRLKVKKQIETALNQATLCLKEVYCLEGKLEPAQLSFMHKILMKTMYNQAKKQPADQRNATQANIIKAYEQPSKLDYGQLMKLLPVLKSS